MPVINQQLIRSFSDDLRQDRPGDILGRGLSTAVAIDRQRERNSAALRDQWNFLLAEGRKLAIDLIPDEETVLLSQSRQLHKAWTSFCKSLPKDQRIETSQDIPSLKLLYQHVARASETWRGHRDGTKTGRLKTVFTRLCETFQSHSKLVSMIPTNDKYVTLLTGSLSAIASACTNHEKLAAGVADSLEELSQDMAYWNGLISLFPDQGMMQRYIMELYTVVFEFLTEIFTQWSKSSWKRFIKSFDEQAFHDLFVEKRKRMKAIEHRMERHANAAHMQSDLTSQRDAGQWRSEMQLQVQTLTQMIQKLGMDVQGALEDKIMQHPSHKYIEPLNISGEAALEPLPPVTPLPDETPVTHDAANSKPSPSISRSKTKDVLALLEPIATQYNSRIQDLVQLVSRALDVTVDIQIKRRLETWTLSLTSNRIWIQGPHDVSFPSQNTLTAACLVGLANNNKIPVISYFGSLQRDQDFRGAYISPPEILLDMVRSIVVQLLLLREDPNSAIETPLAEFEKLLSPVEELDAALSLLRSLRALVPQYLLCVIDSVQVLEDRSDRGYTDNLRKVLREVINLGQPEPSDEAEAGTGRTVKVCFTSDGHVDVLAVAVQGGFLEKIAYDEDQDGDGEQLRTLWDDEARSDEEG